MVCRSVDLISRRISSMDLERKVEDSVAPVGRLCRRRPLIKSSNERWKRESISEGPDIGLIQSYRLTTIQLLWGLGSI